MEKPKNCLQCPLRQLKGLYYCSANVKPVFIDIPDWCPIISEIPNKHGRIIDINDLEPDTEWDDYYDGFTSYSKLELQSISAILEATNNEE